MKKYTTRIDCEVSGQWRTAGVPFHLTDAQAAELCAPRGNVVSLWMEPDVVTVEANVEPIAEEEVEPVNGGFGRNKRRNRRSS